MQRRRFLGILIYAPGAAAVTSASGGCGMFLYPERINAPRSNQIDWKVAALDGLGLILFFVPGVVAFAVDFYTGAIYLPAGHANGGPAASRIELERYDIPRDELKVSTLENVVSNHVGTSVSLRADNSRVSQLEKLEAFKAQVEHHQRDSGFGHRLQAFFAPWKSRFGVEA